MHPFSFFLLFLPLLALSSPLPSLDVNQPPATSDLARQIIGYWTISSFSRSCSPIDNLCNYAFELREGSDLNADSYVCIMSADGTSQTDFSQRMCAGFEVRFLVNGGWNGHGKTAFLTLVVTDQVAGGYAFFRFAEGSFDKGLWSCCPRNCLAVVVHPDERLTWKERKTNPQDSRYCRKQRHLRRLRRRHPPLIR